MKWINVTDQLPKMEELVMVKWHDYILHGYFIVHERYIAPGQLQKMYTFKSILGNWRKKDEYIALSAEMSWSEEVVFAEIDRPKDKYIAITVNAD